MGRMDDEAEKLAAAWRPWRSHAVLHLWNSLETAPWV
jgi:3-methyladenine DNA glycosylase/8-oxoguanine DNA glycosylase